jgi:gas vesicle protein
MKFLNYFLLYKSAIGLLISVGLILPIFVFSQNEINQLPKAPETFEEVKELGIDFLKELPSTMKKGWQEALKFWGKMWQKFKNFWKVYIWSKIKNILDKILSLFKGEIQKRKEIFKEEFKKEKQELKKDFPQLKKFFEKLKKLIE